MIILGRTLLFAWLGILLVCAMGCSSRLIRLKDGAVAKDASTKAMPQCQSMDKISPSGESSGAQVPSSVYQTPKEIQQRTIKKKTSGRYRGPFHSGIVLAKLEFFTDGTIKRIKFLRGESGFYDDIISSVETWRLQPHLVNGCPVETHTVYLFKYQFSADPGSSFKVDFQGYDFTALDRLGKEIKLSDFVAINDSIPGQKKKVLLAFVSVHCTPCLAEMQVLRKYQNLFQENVQVIVLVAEDADALSKINQLLNPDDTPFPVIIDNGLVIYSRFSGGRPDVGFPFNILIGENGQAIKAIEGFEDEAKFLSCFRP